MDFHIQVSSPHPVADPTKGVIEKLKTRLVRMKFDSWFPRNWRDMAREARKKYDRIDFDDYH